jgi:hypothetical protein
MLGRSLSGAAGESANSIPPGDVLAVMKRVADWQSAYPSKHRPDDWTQAAGYAGMIAPMRAQVDDILAHPSDAPSLDFTLPQHKSQELWSWCDALLFAGSEVYQLASLQS